jgi:hypothetical protein
MGAPTLGSFKCVRVFGFFLIDLLSHGDLRVKTPSQRLGHALNRELEGFQVQVQGAGEPPPPNNFFSLIN